MADKSDKAEHITKSSILILATVADTTWRMLTPVIILLVGGIILDKRLESGVLFSILGVCTGFIIAILLVRQQYYKALNEDKDVK